MPRSVVAKRPATHALKSRGIRHLDRFPLISFFLIFVLPSALFAIYFGLIASDRFTAEISFTVRAVPAPALQTGQEGPESVPLGAIVQTTQVIMSYLDSRTLVEELEKKIELRQLYSDASIDYLSRMAPDAKIEKFVKYWRSMTNVAVQPATGIVTLTVQAYSADDAVRIAETCVKESEAVVNAMSSALVEDSLNVSKEAEQRAEAHLAKTRSDLEKARNGEAMISSEQSAASSLQLVTSVRSDLLKLQQSYETQKRFIDESSPQMRALRSRIQAAKNEVERLESTVSKRQGNSPAPALSESLARLDGMALENKLAETQYSEARARLETARLASEAKLMYAEVFLHPQPAQQAKYPRRMLDVFLGSGAALGLWLLLAGLVSLVRRSLD